MSDDIIKRLLDALAAGPTPGPWSVETVPTSCGVCHKVGPFPGKRPDDPPRHACLYADYPSAENPADDELMANANFIAACNPENIAALLAHVDAQAAEIERLRAERDNARARFELAAKLLTGIHALLYPPPTTLPDGRTFVFRPENPGPHEVLQELSDRIRALPDEIAAINEVKEHR